MQAFDRSINWRLAALFNCRVDPDHLVLLGSQFRQLQKRRTLLLLLLQLLLFLVSVQKSHEEALLAHIVLILLVIAADLLNLFGKVGFEKLVVDGDLVLLFANW